MNTVNITMSIYNKNKKLIQFLIFLIKCLLNMQKNGKIYNHLKIFNLQNYKKVVIVSLLLHLKEISHKYNKKIKQILKLYVYHNKLYQFIN